MMNPESMLQLFNTTMIGVEKQLFRYGKEDIVEKLSFSNIEITYNKKTGSIIVAEQPDQRQELNISPNCLIGLSGDKLIVLSTSQQTGNIAISSLDLRKINLKNVPKLESWPINADDIKCRINDVTLMPLADGRFVIGGKYPTETAKISSYKIRMHILDCEQKQVNSLEIANKWQEYAIQTAVKIADKQIACVYKNLSPSTKDIKPSLLIWDVEKKTCILQAELPSTSCRFLKFSSDGMLLFMSDSPTAFYSFDVKNSKFTKLPEDKDSKNKTGAIACMVVPLAEQDSVACGYKEDNIVRIWNIQNGKCIYENKCKDSNIMITNYMDNLIIGSGTSINIFDKDFKIIQTIELGFSCVCIQRFGDKVLFSGREQASAFAPISHLLSLEEIMAPVLEMVKKFDSERESKETLTKKLEQVQQTAAAVNGNYNHLITQIVGGRSEPKFSIKMMSVEQKNPTPTDIRLQDIESKTFVFVQDVEKKWHCFYLDEIQQVKEQGEETKENADENKMEGNKINGATEVKIDEIKGLREALNGLTKPVNELQDKDLGVVKIIMADNCGTSKIETVQAVARGFFARKEFGPLKKAAHEKLKQEAPGVISKLVTAQKFDLVKDVAEALKQDKYYELVKVMEAAETALNPDIAQQQQPT